MINPKNSSNGPRIRAAHYDRGVLHLTLGGAALEGATLSIPAHNLAPLAPLSDEQLAQVQIVGNGSALAWREANIDFAAPGLVERIVGIRSQRAHLESIADTTSEAKAASARTNGAKGGKPRKTANASN